jgi:uncharacterized membrane protein YdjX (TVP38/TMEM64 family)
MQEEKSDSRFSLRLLITRHHIITGIFGIAVVTIIFLSGVFMSGLLSGEGWCNLCPHFTPAGIIEFIRSSGYWGVAVSIGIMMAHSFIPFPAEFVAIANGILYGAFWGIVITWTGAMLGAFLAFGLVRIFGRSFVRRMLDRKTEQKLDEWIVQHGSGTLLVSRFIPIIAFNLINYAAGLTRVSWWTFAWTTGLGILPMTVLMVIMGWKIADLPWLVWFLVALVVLILWLLMHYFQKRTGKKRFS